MYLDMASLTFGRPMKWGETSKHSVERLFIVVALILYICIKADIPAKNQDITEIYISIVINVVLNSDVVSK